MEWIAVELGQKLNKIVKSNLYIIIINKNNL